MRRALPVVTWLTGLCGAAAVLVVAGRGALAGPDLSAPSSWASWASGRDPVDAAVAVVRTGLLAVTVYLLAVTILGLAARAAALPRVIAGVDVAGGPLVRRVLSGAAGAGLALATLAPGVAMAQTPTPPPTAVMRLLDEPPPVPTTTTPTTAPTTSAAPAPTTAPTTPAAPITPTMVVAPGDSFWSIAEHHVTARLRRTPTEHEVATYWRRLVAANADRLVVAGQPDLVYPGQTFRLPE